jgi:hypothetical protein
MKTPTVINQVTEFEDKNGTIINIGDIVQYQVNALTQGPTKLRVARDKKGLISLIDPHKTSKKGLRMSKVYERYVRIIDTSAREA